eukprot:2658775-Rhodomonas_salina.1
MEERGKEETFHSLLNSSHTVSQSRVVSSPRVSSRVHRTHNLKWKVPPRGRKEHNGHATCAIGRASVPTAAGPPQHHRVAPVCLAPLFRHVPTDPFTDTDAFAETDHTLTQTHPQTIGSDNGTNIGEGWKRCA